MAVKIFISYAHEDEKFKNELITHLSSLKRKSIIELWHDRCINPGMKWKEEIDSNLSNSNIILFLVSADFLASDYCITKEAKQAMEQHDNNQSILIPIVIRPVDWLEEELSRFQGLPTDAKAISLWPDRDSAWLNVVNGIKKILDEMPKKPHEHPIAKVVSDMSNKGCCQDFLENLNTTDIKLSHRKIDNIRLSDIFVYPDIVKIQSDDDSIINHQSSDMVF